MLDKPSPETSDLVSTEANPVPEGARVEWLMTTDGTRLRTARWEATKHPVKGTVLLLHGRTEFIEKYFETVSELRARGFGVLTFDWRGQGGSSRLLRDPLKGHVEHFDQYLTDLDTVLQAIALPDCKPPLYILAHSSGALVALRAAPALGNRIERMVLLTPLLALGNLPVRQTWLQRIFGILSFVGLGQSMVGRARAMTAATFEGNRLTRDRARFDRNRALLTGKPDLRVGPPTIGWLFAAFRAMQDVRQLGYANAISIPTMMILAGADEVVRSSVAEAYATRMRTGDFLTILGARHELLMERDSVRKQVLAAFDSFIPGGV